MMFETYDEEDLEPYRSKTAAELEFLVTSADDAERGQAAAELRSRAEALPVAYHDGVRDGAQAVMVRVRELLAAAVNKTVILATVNDLLDLAKRRNRMPPAQGAS